ncbi:beta-ketoacyl synthase N-terminal-like domain-containing protein [Staphylococcus hominis]|uniref:beta-ketoacyl synthase N-terminal-like domain-containing protein n=1 Tax=Staphylococcus hominis TaxID=1290 RepID=UPI003D0822E1
MKNKRVVITGIGIVSSIGMDKKEVVENLMNGQHGISNIKSFNTDKFISQIGGEVKNGSVAK